jgi:hypothetical protein
MAELMAEDSKLRATTAIRRILKAPGESDIRRLQVKWKAVGPQLLAGALAKRKLRRELEQERRTAAFRNRIKEQHEQIARDVSAMLGLDSPALRLARQMADSPALRAAWELYDSPAMKAAREFYDSPAAQLAREIAESPALRAARELYDSPAVRAAREIYDSPTMRAARELYDSPVMRLARRFQAG